MSQPNDMSDVIELLENSLRSAIDREEKRLLEERALLQTVYQRAVGSPYADRGPIRAAQTYTSSFISDLIPTLKKTLE